MIHPQSGLLRAGFFIDQWLDQVQALLSARQFFRLNRQYLIIFIAVKEVEHYFDRKLLLKLLIPNPEKLLVGKEKTIGFLNWPESR